MGIDTAAELRVLAYAAIFGVLLALLYEIYRFLRLAADCRPIAVFLQDLSFFSTAALLTALFICTFHNGMARLSIFVFMAAGFAFWYFLPGRLLYRFFCRRKEKIRAGFRFLSAPFRGAGRGAARFLKQNGAKIAQNFAKNREKRRKNPPFSKKFQKKLRKIKSFSFLFRKKRIQ